jgi:glutathione peroxidase
MLNRKTATLLMTGALVLTGAMALGNRSQAEDKKVAPTLDFTMKDIDGKDVKLSKYQGKVLLVMNVASFCGNTKQYTSMEAMYKKYKSQGFELLAFPANEFGKQEPGSDKEIKEFCTAKYNVSFPMFSKIVVKGEGQHPLYKYLTSKDTDPKFGGDIEWNFDKFLINRKGEIIGRFKPGLDPMQPAVVTAVEAALAEK